MAVSWTSHRFSGGVLALDVTNTVVLRGDAARSFDRFDDLDEMARFAEAASRYRPLEFAGRRLDVDDPRRIAPKVLTIRETADRLFRQAVLQGSIESGALAPFLVACADGLEGKSEPVALDGRLGGPADRPLAFEAALAVSALSLLSQAKSARVRICANCRWLFLDESRNRSRLWCDMTVCGNRQKARRHYDRRRNRGGNDG